MPDAQPRMPNAQCPNAPMPTARPTALLPYCPTAPLPQCPNAPMPYCPNAPMPQCMPECPNARMPNAPMARLRLELIGQCSRDEVVLHVDDDERALARYAWFGFGFGSGAGAGYG